MALIRSTEFTEEIDSSDHQKLHLHYVVVGDCKVGKSSIVRRFTKNEFSDSYTTMYTEFDWRKIVLDQNIIQLSILDFSGRETWRSFRVSAFSRADGMIIVYNVTDRESFYSVERRVKELNIFGGEAVKYLVGNKCDLKDNKVVTYLEGKKLADKLGIYFLETSAKDGTNVEQLFILLASAIVKQKLQPTNLRCDSILSDNIKHNQRRLTCCCEIS